jgi:hypothetical protein
MNGVTYFAIFFILGLETHLNLNKDISPTIHHLILWIEVFIFLPFMVYMIAENKSKEIRQHMFFWGLFGFILGFVIFK